MTAASTQQNACGAPPERPGPGSAACWLLTPLASPPLHKLATPAAVIAAALSSHTKRRAVFSGLLSGVVA